MNNEFNALEKEMINFDFESLQKDVEVVKANFAAAAAPANSKVCELWSKIRKFIVPLKHIPVVGKFVEMFVEILDSICPKD